VHGATQVAEAAVSGNRAASEYALENLGVMFPEILNKQSKQCYRAALSNYVEDDWDKSFNTGMWQRQESFCKKNPSICNGKQENYFVSVRDKMNPFHLLFRDLTVIGDFIGTFWITAAESYKKERQLTHSPDGKGGFYPAPDEQMLANYHKYLTNCATLKPLTWVVPNEQLLKSDATFCIGKCP
jgi:hypothetical protein